jgi:predicted enzyme related to lactoylglutathione lyase
VESESPFIWHELVTSDQQKSGEFFCELLGWKSSEVDAGDFGVYTLFKKGNTDVAGMMNPTQDTPGKGSYWHSYIAVENVDLCIEKTPKLGGKVIVQPHEVPDVGRICIVEDPTGAIAHLMQPVEK